MYSSNRFFRVLMTVSFAVSSIRVTGAAPVRVCSGGGEDLLQPRLNGFNRGARANVAPDVVGHVPRHDGRGGGAERVAGADVHPERHLKAEVRNPDDVFQRGDELFHAGFVKREGAEKVDAPVLRSDRVADLCESDVLERAAGR